VKTVVRKVFGLVGLDWMYLLTRKYTNCVATDVLLLEWLFNMIDQEELNPVRPFVPLFGFHFVYADW
jgi:hypothetical protein